MSEAPLARTTQALLIRLRSPVSFSASGASTGGHRTLSSIPGAALRGLCAAALYDSFTDEERWDAFHSGAVRFGDGLPSPDGETIAWPTPRALHGLKDDKAPKRYNLALAQRVALSGGAPAQFEAERSGFTLDGPPLRRVPVIRGATIKTALTPGSGVAEEGRLYDQEFLAEGQSFIAILDADEDAGPLLERCVDALVGRRRLGRSRRAEFGEVVISRLEKHFWPSTCAAPDQKARVWLLSDVCVVGDPLERLAAEFDLKESDVDLASTFVATRSFAPFNGHFREHEHERRLLVAGSVITFNASLKEGVRMIGLDQALGFGRVAVNPVMLTHEELAVDVVTAGCSASSDAASLPDTSLGRWMQASLADQRFEDALDEKGEAALTPLAHLIPPAEGGPSRTQWRRLHEATLAVASLPQLRAALFEGAQPIIGASDRAWSATIPSSQHTYVQRLRAMIDAAENLGDLEGLTQASAARYRVRVLAQTISSHLRALEAAKEASAP